MFTLSLRTDNAAFDDGPELEVAAILRSVADRIKKICHTPCIFASMVL